MIRNQFDVNDYDLIILIILVYSISIKNPNVLSHINSFIRILPRPNHNSTILLLGFTTTIPLRYLSMTVVKIIKYRVLIY